MIEPTFRALLVPAIGAASLAQSGLIPARWTAITLPPVTVRTQKKDRATFAPQAKAEPQRQLAMTRHACSQAALDTIGCFVALWNQFGCGGLTKVAIPEPRRSNDGVPSCFPPSTSHYTVCRLADDRINDRVFAADDVTRLDRRSENYVFR
jgi:hypothetical protein